MSNVTVCAMRSHSTETNIHHDIKGYELGKDYLRIQLFSGMPIYYRHQYIVWFREWENIKDDNETA